MVPSSITFDGGKICVPNNPIIPVIIGDGIGQDVTPTAIKVLDAAVKKAYGNEKKISWKRLLAGEKAYRETQEWLPEKTLDYIKEHIVAIKGPLTTPVGGGFRSLNVTLRQRLDLFACVRPVRWFEGVPSPVKEPEKVNMVIFRENTEDIYAGIEWEAGTQEVKKVINFMESKMNISSIRFPKTSALGIKPVSKEGSKRLIRASLKYAIENHKKSVTLVHKGNIMKFTEGGFRDWGYELATDEYNATPINGGPWHSFKNPETGEKIILKDVIADAMLQQILTRPSEYEIIATLNLNGDYISDALAAQVGGIGIAPGANINYDSGHALFEATHGTAPKYAGKDKVNPGSVILSGEMMLRYLNWTEAADLIIKGMETTIGKKTVTYDFERLMEGAKLLKCSEFGDAIVSNL